MKYTPTFAGLGTLIFTGFNVESGLRILLYVVTIAFTLWRWRTDSKKKDRNERHDSDPDPSDP